MDVSLLSRFRSRTSFFVPSLAAVGLFAFYACAGRLPEKRPADFRVRYNFHPGMLPYSESIDLNRERVIYRLNYRQREITLRFQRGPLELDRLYNQLRRNQFPGIKSERRRVRDRGGTSIALFANGRSYEVSDSGESFVRKKYQTAYNRSVSAVLSAVKRPPRGEIIFFDIRLEDSLFRFFGPGAKIELDLGRAYLYAPYDARDVGLIVFDEKKTYPVLIRSASPKINYKFTLLPGKMKGGRLGARGDRLVFRPR